MSALLGYAAMDNTIDTAVPTPVEAGVDPAAAQVAEPTSSEAPAPTSTEAAPAPATAPADTRADTCEPAPVEPTTTDAVAPSTEVPTPTCDQPPVSTLPPVQVATPLPVAEPAGSAAQDPAPTQTTAPATADVDRPDIPLQPVDGWPVRAIRFPVAGPVQFWDDWGDCRGGSECPRHHIGNDIIADRLQPIIATTDGTITHLVDNHPTAGWGLTLTDAEGWKYNYYHMNNDHPGTDDGQDDGTWRFAPGIAEGTQVVAGQILGWVGDSGNAETSVPHLHFEIHDPLGEPVDPYLSLRLAEWLDSCLGKGDPYQDVLLPISLPENATVQVDVDGGNGYFLLAPDGTWVPVGTAKRTGYAANINSDPACDAPYAQLVDMVRASQH